MRASPYEKGTFFVRGQEWRVGDRYQLLRLIGDGTFSTVCSALDTLTGEQVALKRIPDVLSSPELTKKVVREVCILRRLDHPFIISLRDAFIQPSSSGPLKMVNGSLVSSSLDVYIAMELAQEGDIFNLRGQMSEDEVRALMWQMLQALRYLHGVDVWHRDLKSSNVLLSSAGGHRIVKVADFGSARSATREGYHWAEQERPEPSSAISAVQANGDVSIASATGREAADGAQQQSAATPGQLRHQDSFSAPSAASSGVRRQDLHVLIGQQSMRESQAGAGVGYQSPLTVMVATPCYRAPEVVMSRGGYTSAIDMWSLGCIFGELLQRVRRVGSASTPHLHVAPLFAMHGIPTTPQSGEKWGDDEPSNPTTRSELAALFGVIGTPAWADVARVRACAWRKFLQKCSGRPPSLYRRFGHAGEATTHLLTRMLAFDPERRCSAEEALAHQYFAHLERSVTELHDAHVANAELDALQMHDGPDFLSTLRSLSLSNSPTRSIDELLQAASSLDQHQNGHAMQNLPAPCQQGTTSDQRDSSQPLDIHRADSRRHHSSTPHLSSSVPHRDAEVHMHSASTAVQPSESWPGGTGVNLPSPGKASEAAVSSTLERWRSRRISTEGSRPKGYHEEADAAKALHLLEDEMHKAECSANGAAQLRALLERECGAQAREGAWRLIEQQTAAGKPPSDVLVSYATRDGTHISTRFEEDQSGMPSDPAKCGRERLTFVADTWKGALDPEQHLRPDRHQEWSVSSRVGPAAGPAWGVNSLPPGMTAEDAERLVRTMSRQQGR